MRLKAKKEKEKEIKTEANIGYNSLLLPYFNLKLFLHLLLKTDLE